MSEQNTEFDKWFDDYEHNNDIRLAINYGAYDIAGDAWQSATAESKKRINELEGEVAELQKRLETHIAINKSLLLQRDCLQADNKRLREGVAIIKNSSDSIKTILELQASNNSLHEVLEKVSNCLLARGGDEYLDPIINATIASTPAESLQAHDDEVIEKCAKVCEGGNFLTESSPEYMFAKSAAKTIRSLKEAE